ncbi:MAG: hypothetical protein ABIG32_00750 [Candidatus Uhrbacteria bacterium]|nr:hypothetical protein [Patescibacteria group bacterium]MBU1906725.1 hypothetical protein [Patescibacteria group bacterium]
MSRTKEVLLDLIHMSSMAMTSGRSMPSEFMLDRYSYERYIERNKQYRAKEAIKRMEEQNLFKIKETGDKIMFKLDNKGKQTGIKEAILQTESELPGDLRCLVSFDIPEYVKETRVVLRQFLKKAGFKQVHRSVWQSKLNVINLMKSLVNEMDAGEWVKVYQAVEG